MSLLGQPTRDVAIDWHPHIELVIESLDPPPEMRAPKFVLARYISQRLERDRGFDGPTIGSHQAFRFHDYVGIEIFALAVGPNPIGLNSQWAEIEFISLAAVVERIKENADVIIVPDIVALRDRGAHFVRLVVTMKGYVNKFRVIAQHHLSWFGRRDIVTRLNLIEVLQDDRALPNFII